MRKLLLAVVLAGLIALACARLAQDERLRLFWYLATHSQCTVPEGAGRWVKVMATKSEDGVHVLCWQQDFDGPRRNDKEYRRLLNLARKEVELRE